MRRRRDIERLFLLYIAIETIQQVIQDYTLNILMHIKSAPRDNKQETFTVTSDTVKKLHLLSHEAKVRIEQQKHTDQHS